MFFNSWYALVRVFIVGVCAYAALVLLLRVSGKRTLTKFNAFDFVVTVALGSTLATILLSKDVALAEGAMAFAVLIALQYVVAWLSVRFSTFGGLVKSEPSLLLYRGRFLYDTMRSERVTEGEIRAAIREQGVLDVENVEAVVLETAGSISIITSSEASPSSLSGVRGFEQHVEK